MSVCLAYEVALQLGLHGDVEVQALVLGEDPSVRRAWDVSRQPWFNCHNLVRKRASLRPVPSSGCTHRVSLLVL